jgi:hypothetical protein
MLGAELSSGLALSGKIRTSELVSPATLTIELRVYLVGLVRNLVRIIGARPALPIHYPLRDLDPTELVEVNLEGRISVGRRAPVTATRRNVRSWLEGSDEDDNRFGISGRRYDGS